MEINTTDGPGFLVEANVVETLEAGPIYGPHSMVRYKETFLPAHENIFFRSKIGNGDITTLSYRLGVGPEGSEFVPVGHVNLVGCAPVWVIRQKPIFRADDLAFEKGCERGVVFRQAYPCRAVSYKLPLQCRRACTRRKCAPPNVSRP